MNVQLLRGRDLRPPSRRAHISSVASESSLPTELTPPHTEGPNRKKILRFPVNRETRAFYRRFYPETTSAEWNDWRWQLRSRIRTLSELERVFALSEDEQSAVSRHTGSLPVGITPYYASLMGRDDPSEPLRRTHV